MCFRQSSTAASPSFRISPLQFALLIAVQLAISCDQNTETQSTLLKVDARAREIQIDGSAPHVAGAETKLPRLWIELSDNGILEPEMGWVYAQSDRLLRLQIKLEVDRVEDKIDWLRYQGTEDPDPSLFKHRGPANLTITVFRLTKSGRRQVPIRTRGSGGGKHLCVYSSTHAFHILYPAKERIARIRKSVQDAYPDNARVAEDAFVKYVEPHTVDMPLGDYVITAAYAPKKPGTWSGILTAELNVRIQPPKKH